MKLAFSGQWMHAHTEVVNCAMLDADKLQNHVLKEKARISPFTCMMKFFLMLERYS
jgi:hypothetical protein